MLVNGSVDGVGKKLEISLNLVLLFFCFKQFVILIFYLFVVVIIFNERNGIYGVFDFYSWGLNGLCDLNGLGVLSILVLF